MLRCDKRGVMALNVIFLSKYYENKYGALFVIRKLGSFSVRPEETENKNNKKCKYMSYICVPNFHLLTWRILFSRQNN